LKGMDLDKPENQSKILAAVSAPADKLPTEPKAPNFTRLNLDDKDGAVYKYSIQVPPTAQEQEEARKNNKQPEPTYQALGDYAKSKLKNMQVLALKVTALVPQQQTDPKAAPLPPKEQTQEMVLGPVDVADLQKQIDDAKKQGQVKSVDIKQRWEVSYLANKSGEVAIGVGSEVDASGKPVASSTPFAKIEELRGQSPTIFKESPEAVRKMMEDAKTNPQSAKQPTRVDAKLVAASGLNIEPWRFFLCIFMGIFMAYVFERLTDYYVSLDRQPVKDIAVVSSAGPAPMIIQGFSLAAESSVFSVLAIVFALMAPLFIFPPEQFGGYILSFYGIALVGLGLLTCTGYILAMDTFGPISDNAQGVFEMSGAGHDNPEASKAVQRLDAAGNTTKALTKGFAIATAVVAAVALFHSYVEDSFLTEAGMRLEVPEIFLGLLIGGAAPYLFSAFSINAVGRAAFDLINEVRRQFREDSGIMAGTSKPNYAVCVQIVTAAAQRELLGPGILAIFLPVAVAFGFAMRGTTTTVAGVEYNLVGAQALGGFLAGTILSGQLFAVLLANAGGMWDNSKKLIEDGMYGGKGTDAHKAAVVCDTVGDPFKDTAGPALNPLIKVMNLVALLLAPVIVRPMPKMSYAIITVISFAFLAFAFSYSKRGSMGSGMQDAQNEGKAEA